MSVVHVVADMECDRCKVVARIVTDNLSNVRKKARAQGWSNDGRKDFCVNCNTNKSVGPIVVMGVGVMNHTAVSRVEIKE